MFTIPALGGSGPASTFRKVTAMIFLGTHVIFAVLVAIPLYRGRNSVYSARAATSPANAVSVTVQCVGSIFVSVVGFTQLSGLNFPSFLTLWLMHLGVTMFLCGLTMRGFVVWSIAKSWLSSQQAAGVISAAPSSQYTHRGLSGDTINTSASQSSSGLDLKTSSTQTTRAGLPLAKRGLSHPFHHYLCVGDCLHDYNTRSLVLAVAALLASGVIPALAVNIAAPEFALWPAVKFVSNVTWEFLPLLCIVVVWLVFLIFPLVMVLHCLLVTNKESQSSLQGWYTAMMRRMRNELIVCSLASVIASALCLGWALAPRGVTLRLSPLFWPVLAVIAVQLYAYFSACSQDGGLWGRIRGRLALYIGQKRGQPQHQDLSPKLRHHKQATLEGSNCLGNIVVCETSRQPPGPQSPPPMESSWLPRPQFAGKHRPLSLPGPGSAVASTESIPAPEAANNSLQSTLGVAETSQIAPTTEPASSSAKRSRPPPLLLPPPTSPRRGRYIMPRNMDKSSRYRWRGFLRMLRSAEEYGAVKDYAEKVYCSELTTFIDEYQYIKLCLVQLLADTHDEDTRQVNAGLGNDIPTTTATDEHPSSRQQSFLERLQQSKISLARLPGILKSKLAPTTVLSHQPSPPMDNTSKASLLSKHLAVPPAKVSISPANVKLLETLKQQYPKLHLTADAPIPDTIQMLMLEFVRGYIDPSSELAVNLDSKTANEALEVIRSGERLGWDLLETAKDQVLELIYYNVYIPYCIEIDNRQFEDFFGIKPFYVK